MLHVREIKSIDDVSTLRGHWDDLLDRAVNHSIFQTWEWTFCCYRHFTKDDNILLLSVWDDGKLAGLVPMQINYLWKLPVRRLQFAGNGISDYLDFIVDSKIESAVLSCIYDWLNENGKNWDILDLQSVPEWSTIFRYQNIDQLDQSTIDQDISFSISLPATYDEYIKSLGKKTRSDLRYHERLTDRSFDNVRYHIYGISDFQSGLKELYHLHTLRWQDKGQSGVLSESVVRDFYIDVAGYLAKRGWLRLESLFLDDKIAAIDLNFAYRGKVYGYIRGFDLEYSKYSPGSLLMVKSIESAIEQGMKEFDFMKGNESYKKHWTNSRSTSLRIVAKNSNIRSHFGSMISQVDRKIGWRTRKYLHQLKRVIFPGIDTSKNSIPQISVSSE